jgi:hypothetical protein|tara:strand:+ start:126 stop:344 length:219 start_codon:yes stop_codon:yes gene_type:complete
MIFAGVPADAERSTALEAKAEEIRIKEREVVATQNINKRVDISNAFSKTLASIIRSKNLGSGSVAKIAKKSA